MEEIVCRIIEKYIDLFKDDTKFEKINIGFTNTIFSLDDKYILKICSDTDNEPKFKKEIDFYNQNKNSSLLPKLYYYDTSKKVIPYYYEIIEKIKGTALYNVWHTFNEYERKNIIKQLCEAMKQFHSIKCEKYDWASYIISNFNQLYVNAKNNNLFSIAEIEIIDKAFLNFKQLLKSDDFVLVHNDLHFDNIIYNNGEIKLIDFERAIVAPKDFELDILYRMVRMPWKFASEETEKYIKKEDYLNIINYIKEFYPDLINTPNLYERLAIYDMLYFMKQYEAHSEYEELKIPIIESAKLILK